MIHNTDWNTVLRGNIFNYKCNDDLLYASGHMVVDKKQLANTF